MVDTNAVMRKKWRQAFKCSAVIIVPWLLLEFLANVKPSSRDLPLTPMRVLENVALQFGAVYAVCWFLLILFRSTRNSSSNRELFVHVVGVLSGATVLFAWAIGIASIAWQ